MCVCLVYRYKYRERYKHNTECICTYNDGIIYEEGTVELKILQLHTVRHVFTTSPANPCVSIH